MNTLIEKGWTGEVSTRKVFTLTKKLDRPSDLTISIDIEPVETGFAVNKITVNVKEFEATTTEDVYMQHQEGCPDDSIVYALIRESYFLIKPLFKKILGEIEKKVSEIKNSKEVHITNLADLVMLTIDISFGCIEDLL